MGLILPVLHMKQLLPLQLSALGQQICVPAQGQGTQGIHREC